MRKIIIALAGMVGIAILAMVFIVIPLQVAMIRLIAFPYNTLYSDGNHSIMSNFSLSTPPFVYKTPSVDISFDYATPVIWTQISSFFCSLNETKNFDLNSFKWSDATYHIYHVFGTLRDLPNSYYEVKVYAGYANGTSVEVDRGFLTVNTDFKEPTLKVISPINQKTYNTHEVELSYTTNSEVIMAYYSLDKDQNADDWIYFKGNTTLTNLSEGSHKLILFVATQSYSLSGSTPYHTVDFNVETTK